MNKRGILLVVFAFVAIMGYLSVQEYGVNPTEKPAYNSESLTEIIDRPISPATISIGSQAVVPSWEWVQIINEKPVVQYYSNEVYQMLRGDKCGIEFGGVVTVIEARGEDLVVEYAAPGDPLGTRCPSGVRFIVNKTNFSKMSAEYATTDNRIQEEKDVVNRLLARHYYGEPMDAGEWEWIHVVNVTPVVQIYSNGSELLSYGDSCGCGSLISHDGKRISEGGTIHPRGEANGRVLYEYTAKDDPMGTPCPSGVLFFKKK